MLLIRTAMMIGVALLIETSAFAQPYTVRYEASGGLAPDASCPEWTLTETGNTAVVAGGVLTISGGVQNHVLTYEVPVSFASPVVVEFRARRIAGTTSSTAREQLGVGIATAPGHGILFFVGPDVVFLTNGFGSRGPQAVVDTDAMHTYRIEVLAGVARVFYDNVQILTGNTYSSTEFPAATIAWGDITNLADGTSEWEYVEHNSSAVTCGPTGASRAAWGSLKLLYR